METLYEFESRLSRTLGKGNEARPLPAAPSGGRVMVVDDEPLNRKLLSVQFEANDLETVEAADGTEACSMVNSVQPDAILLDVMMPGIDGFEVCRRIKSDPKTSHIPVLMVSALQHKEMAYRGIAAGADGFINKPIDLKEVVLRTRNAMRMKQASDCDRDSKSTYRGFVNDVVGELCAPLGAMGAVLDEVNEAGGLSEELREKVELAKASAKRLRMVNLAMTGIHQLEAKTMPVRREKVELRSLVEKASKMLGVDDGVQNVIPENVSAYCDSGMTLKVMAHLIENGIRHNNGAGNRSVSVTALIDEGKAVACVTDNGEPIPTKYRGWIFEPFGRVPNDGDGRKDAGFSGEIGLGLTFCKAAVRAQGGEIGLMEPTESGNTFYITLPTEGE